LEGERTQAAVPPGPQHAADLNAYEQIRRLAELRDDWHITSEEFDEKKREMLDRM
jgi:hypothetical protein